VPAWQREEVARQRHPHSSLEEIEARCGQSTESRGALPASRRLAPRAPPCRSGYLMLGDGCIVLVLVIDG
jgi:hypothetical protein